MTISGHTTNTAGNLCHTCTSLNSTAKSQSSYIGVARRAERSFSASNYRCWPMVSSGHAG